MNNMGEAELRHALQQCLRLQEQHKAARETLLLAYNRESVQAERLRYDVEALANSLKV